MRDVAITDKCKNKQTQPTSELGAQRYIIYGSDTLAEEWFFKLCSDVVVQRLSQTLNDELHGGHTHLTLPGNVLHTCKTTLLQYESKTMDYSTHYHCESYNP